MTSVDPIAQSLFFSASAEAARKSFDTKKEEKASSVKKSSFSSLMEKEAEEKSLTQIGLPKELVGLSQEEAIVFLKDEVDTAGDELKHSFTPMNFARFRSALGSFIKYVEKNNYEVLYHKRRGRNKNPRVEIKIINQKLDTLASDLIYNQKSNIQLLAQVDEIKGLIVDLLAV